MKTSIRNTMTTVVLAVFVFFVTVAAQSDTEVMFPSSFSHHILTRAGADSLSSIYVNQRSGKQMDLVVNVLSYSKGQFNGWEGGVRTSVPSSGSWQAINIGELYHKELSCFDDRHYELSVWMAPAGASSAEAVATATMAINPVDCTARTVVEGGPDDETPLSSTCDMNGDCEVLPTLRTSAFSHNLSVDAVGNTLSDIRVYQNSGYSMNVGVAVLEEETWNQVGSGSVRVPSSDEWQSVSLDVNLAVEQLTCEANYVAQVYLSRGDASTACVLHNVNIQLGGCNGEDQQTVLSYGVVVDETVGASQVNVTGSDNWTDYQPCHYHYSAKEVLAALKASSFIL